MSNVLCREKLGTFALLVGRDHAHDLPAHICHQMSECRRSRQWAQCNGMLSFYIDLKAMEGSPREMGDSFAAEVLDYLAFVKSAVPTTPGGEILVPGEPERRLMAERLASGLPLARQAWDDIVETARASGLDPDAHLA